jgi:hypothetical protein
VIGSLCITAPRTAVTRRDEAEIGKLVKKQAEELSAALGAPRRESQRARARGSS